MKTFEEVKAGDLVIVRYYREEEFIGHSHHKICKLKTFSIEDVEQTPNGMKKKITLTLDNDRFNIYGEIVHTFISNKNHKEITFNAPGGLEICCSPLYGIKTKSNLLLDELYELQALIPKAIQNNTFEFGDKEIEDIVTYLPNIIEWLIKNHSPKKLGETDCEVFTLLEILKRFKKEKE